MNIKKLMAAKKVADSKRRIADVKWEDNAIHDNTVKDLLQFLFSNLKEIDWSVAQSWFSDHLEAGYFDNKKFKDRLCSFIVNNFIQTDKIDLVKKSLKFGEKQ